MKTKTISAVRMKFLHKSVLAFLTFLALGIVINSCKKDDSEMVSPIQENEDQVNYKSGNGEAILYFGHETFTRGTGSPIVETRQITNPYFSYFTNQFTLNITNGTNGGNKVSSAIIKIDGVQIFGPSDFSQNVNLLTKPIPNLTGNSLLEVELRGKPGGVIDLWIEGVLTPNHAKLEPTGGTYSLFNGNIQIILPPGAVDTSTYITINDLTANLPPEFLPDDFIQYELLPNGLTFSQPVTFILPYNIEEEKINYPLLAYNLSNGNWESMFITNIDRNNKKVHIQVEHFSIWLIQVQDFYLTVDLPGKYLKKGDLLYALALLESQTQFTWFPGHAAMYLGTDKKNVCSNDGKTYIESSPGGVTCGYLNSDFINTNYHIYLGPRRYIGSISDEQRQEIANYAIDKLGYGYWPVGQGNWQDNRFSCVGLTEASYDSYDLSIVPSLVEIPFLYPYDQYKRTKPIDEINVNSGEELKIKVFGVVWDEQQKFIQVRTGVSYYSNDIPGVIGWSDGSSSNKLYKEFTWTPGNNDIGSTYHVTFKVSLAVQNGYEQRSQTINIHVEPNENEMKMLYIGFIDTDAQPGQPGSHSIEIGKWEDAGYEVDVMSTKPPSVINITSELLAPYKVLRLTNYYPHYYTAAEGQAIADWVDNGGKLLADIHDNDDIQAVSEFGVDHIEGVGGGTYGLTWYYHGAPLVISPVTGPFGVSALGIEAMDRPFLKTNHGLNIAASFDGYPAVVYKDFGDGKVIITFDGGSYSLDVVHPGNAYRSCITYNNNAQFIDNVIDYFEP